jgi:hypothetical protein
MKKTFIIFLLCASLLLEGCYSYTAVREGEQGKIKLDPHSDIQVRQNDGTEFEVKGDHFVSVEMPSNFVYGVGKLIDRNSGNSVDFAGTIYPVSTDSEAVQPIGAWGLPKARRFDFHLKNGMIVQCKQGDFVKVDSMQGPGLWICGKGDFFKFHRNGLRIPYEDISTIEESQFSAGKTALCTIGVAVPAVLMVSFVLMLDSWKRHFQDGLLGGG